MVSEVRVVVVVNRDVARPPMLLLRRCDRRGFLLRHVPIVVREHHLLLRVRWSRDQTVTVEVLHLEGVRLIAESLLFVERRFWFVKRTHNMYVSGPSPL